MKRILLIVIFATTFIGCINENTLKSSSQLPDYSMLSRVRIWTGQGKCGDVLIPSVSREQKSEDREKLLRSIMKKEGWVIISAFSTREAYIERSCDSFPDRSPAFKIGYLGKIDLDGKFYE